MAYIYGIYTNHIVVQYEDCKRRESFLPIQFQQFSIVSNAIWTSREPKTLDEYYQILHEDAKRKGGRS
jgi:hypothetical protein